jgi:prefoldin subunit 5
MKAAKIKEMEAAKMKIQKIQIIEKQIEFIERDIKKINKEIDKKISEKSKYNPSIFHDIIDNIRFPPSFSELRYRETEENKGIFRKKFYEQQEKRFEKAEEKTAPIQGQIDTLREELGFLDEYKSNLENELDKLKESKSGGTRRRRYKRRRNQTIHKKHKTRKYKG